tara:strand:- start:2533 stop:2775 length:243 start_codon:yes stop_codon:yes gene_type:complete
MENTDMKLGDDVIGQVAKLLQLAILTGTDIVDNLRMLRVFYNEDTSELNLSKSYAEISENHIQKLVEKVATLREESISVE